MTFQTFQPSRLNSLRALYNPNKHQPNKKDVFEDLKQWSLAERSSLYPITIRYQKQSDQKMAQIITAQLEKSWQIQIEQMGFRPPIPYDISGQKRLNVFLLRGTDTGAEGVKPVSDPNIGWDAYESFISTERRFGFLLITGGNE